jgi:biopolymer transport protein ExbD
MSQQLTGIYRQEPIELPEKPSHLSDETQVFITVSESPDLRLNTQEITPEQAQQLRHSLASFAEEWNSPEMSIYDDYDAAKLNP